MVLWDYFRKEWFQVSLDYKPYYLLPVLLLLCSVLIWHLLSRTKGKRLPPGPTGLPLVGYLPFLGKEPFKVFDRLSKKYGNVFSLYLGQSYVVILGDYTAVKDALSKSVILDRPEGIFDFLPDSLGFSNANGVEWIEQRRFVVRSMKDIGFGRSTWSRLVEDEITDFLEILAEKKGEPINLHKVLTWSMSNNIASLLCGKRLPPGPDHDFLNTAADKVMSFFSQSSVWNFYPRLCNFVVKLKITSYYETYCDMLLFNKSIRKLIEEQQQSQAAKNHDDFITVYMDAMQTKKAEDDAGTFTETNLIGNTQALFAAGIDTTKGSLLWLFLIMAGYPDVQDKVHRELDSVLEKKGRATWEERMKFPYIYATIMEAQRWKTIVPLNTARQAREDTKICGYDVPKGTVIIGVNWSVHNDTRYWPEPEKFDPNRFLQNGGKEVILKPESYVPFSYGKRKCPGETVALMAIFLYFTSIMHMFDVKVPNGGQPNFEGELGLTYLPVQQKLCFVPRQGFCEKM